MSSGPFECHLREAIALNRTRAPLYAALSNGDTRRLSRLLITAECLLLPVARWFDREAAAYDRAGVPLLDEVFVSMAGAPAFGTVHVGNVSGTRREPLEPWRIRREVQAGYRGGSFPGASRVIAHELERLASAGGHHMARHLLESAHRLTALSAGLIQRSRERGLASPELLLARLLRLHLAGLAPASYLDRRASTFHARGIPIIAQDVPSIPRPGPSTDA